MKSSAEAGAGMETPLKEEEQRERRLKRSLRIHALLGARWEESGWRSGRKQSGGEEKCVKG